MEKEGKMIRAKNRFYRKLKLDRATKDTIKFFRHIKEKMLRDVDNINPKTQER